MTNVTKTALCILISLCITRVYAQQKQTIYAGYGIGTHNEIIDAFTDITVASLTLSNTDFKDHSGTFFVGYRYQIKERMELGGVLAYEHASSTTSQDGQSYDLNQHNYAIMADFRYNYTKSEKLKLFSEVSAGVSILQNKVSGAMEDTDSNVDLGFHIDAFGISYGRTIAPFLAIGYGYKGLVNLGVQARF